MTKPLSPTQAHILTAAAQHPNRLAEPSAGLPAAARSAALQSMLKAGLLEEVLDPGSASPMLQITAKGLNAVEVKLGLPDATGEPVTSLEEGRVGQGSTITLPNTQEAPATPAALRQLCATLRSPAADLLVVWDAGEGRSDQPSAMETLRAALSRAGANRLARDPSAPRPAREGTKQQAVLTLLRKPEGTTITQIMEATGWAQHTVRGFLAGLKTKGHTVEVLERVRQVGSGAQGAKGSYSVYRIATGEQG